MIHAVGSRRVTLAIILGTYLERITHTHTHMVYLTRTVAYITFGEE